MRISYGNPFRLPVLAYAIALLGCAANLNADEQAQYEALRRQQTLDAAAAQADVKIAKSSAEWNTALEAAKNALAEADTTNSEAVLAATAKALDALEVTAAREQERLLEQIVALQRKAENATTRLGESERKLQVAMSTHERDLGAMRDQLQLQRDRSQLLNDRVNGLADQAPPTKQKLAFLHAELTKVAGLQNTALNSPEELDLQALAATLWSDQIEVKTKNVIGLYMDKNFATLVKDHLAEIVIALFGGVWVFQRFGKRKKEGDEPAPAA